ncbi:MAG: hypothetical protein PVJ67_02020 [Candidatus Pacearchaeota archaeon]|jgi:hypothetical protein
MKKIFAGNLNEWSEKNICDYTEMQRIRELPYFKRLKKENIFRAAVFRFENFGYLTKEEARIYRRQFYDENYQLKV